MKQYTEPWSLTFESDIDLKDDDGPLAFGDSRRELVSLEGYR